LVRSHTSGEMGPAGEEIRMDEREHQRNIKHRLVVPRAEVPGLANGTTKNLVVSAGIR